METKNVIVDTFANTLYLPFPAPRCLKGILQLGSGMYRSSFEREQFHVHGGEGFQHTEFPETGVGRGSLKILSLEVQSYRDLLHLWLLL